MIEVTEGNLLLSEAEALVNTVNCMGYMGKGIALQFKKAFPENFKAYAKACRNRQVRPGKMFVHPTGLLDTPKYIINFPTKDHWRSKARLEDIESGLDALLAEIQSLGVRSIAVPPLGCGLGGLEWNTVRPMIERAFSRIPEVRVQLYAPTGSPEAASMPVRTKRPPMTSARALLIELMDTYAQDAYRLTLLEIQKLAYFLQESGEPLRLKYEAAYYGPYAPNLNKVLEMLEGHFIRGYGDSQKPGVEIEILPGAREEASAFLDGHKESRARLRRVGEVIDGFTTPYGMELLATVHWVAHYERPPVSDDKSAARRIRAWNPRKEKMFRGEHIRVAWERLAALGWLVQGA